MPPIPPKSETRLLRLTAARDVRLLISYLSRQAKGSDQLDFSGELADEILGGTNDAAKEQKLWLQLKSLSTAAYPATAESIRDSKYYRVLFGEDNAEERESRGGRQLIGVLAIVAFVLAFIVGGYIQVSEKAIVALQADLTERAHIIEGNLTATRLAGTNNASDQAKVSKYNALKELQAEVVGGFQSIGIASWWINPITNEKVTGADGNEYDLYNTVAIDLQRTIDFILGDFLIPALASFLGVSVFIIRDATLRLESVSLSPLDEVAYWPRIILALIAGLTIGWLAPAANGLSSDGQNAIVTFSSLSKTALAFVVGYSVELLFNVLDALKAALGVRAEKGTGDDTVDTGRPR